MRADPEQRVSESAGRRAPPAVPIIAALVILTVLGVWLFGSREEPAPAPSAPPAALEETPPPVAEPPPEERLPPAPDIPPAPAPEPAPPPEPEPTEPPLTLETSDQPLRDQLAPLLSPVLSTGLEASNLLDRGVAVVDGMSRGAMPYKLLPLARPEGKFTTRKTAGQEYVDPAGFARYDAYAKAIDSLDTDALVAAFHRFRPLLEEAYGSLGYAPEEMDNAVIRALDNIIAAPVVEEPLPVKKVEAVYRYVDAEFEQLPALQKQLLRTGPANTRLIQSKARALRAALLDTR